MKNENHDETEDLHPKPVFLYQPNPDNNRVFDFPFLVKHPSRDFSLESEVMDNRYFKIMSDPEIIEKFIAMLCSYSGFQETENSINVIETFLMAHEENLYPPFWVLDYIAKAFEEYHKSQGTKTLDEAFGLKIGKGHTPLFKKDVEDQRDEMLCHHVFNLCLLFNFSVDDACMMVARYFQEVYWNQTPLKVKDISEATLADRYSKKWKKIFEDDGFDPYRRKVLSRSEKENKVYLQQFLDCLLPEDLRYLKDTYQFS